MSEIEDAAATIARLLRTKMRVVKDDGSLANVSATCEWQNAEAFRNVDGQVTVGLAESSDQKIELTGRTRRRLQLLRVNVWATDSAGTTEPSRVMRGRIVNEALRVIRENRVKPNETGYDFFNVGETSQTHKAYKGDVEAAPASQGWTELTSAEYAQLWYSDDDRCQTSYGENGDIAVLLFRFKVESRENTAKEMGLAFEGYGTAPGGNGVVLKAWNHATGSWSNAVNGGAGGVDETLTINIDSEFQNYIDDDGYAWLLAETLFASDGVSPATLFCDYVSCTVTVNGVTYCDVLSYRDVDRVDVKPFVFCTEITVKSWFFENIGV